ncbi:MAG: YbbR-like domain-containing protein [Oscillospiraceae bacterium]
MTKKTTINKIVGSKAFWIIISLLASFLLWTYIMSTEETTIEMTFSNVKVVYQGADDLRAARGLIVTDADAETVSVRLKGTRRVLGNLSSADLSAVIDVSGISQAREMQVSYSLQYPTNVDKSSITVLSKSPETISFSVVQEANKTLGGQGRLHRQRQGRLHGRADPGGALVHHALRPAGGARRGRQHLCLCHAHGSGQVY